MKSFEGQVAIITGASSGVGRAIASALAAQNATLVLVGRHLPTLTSIADSFATRALCWQVDLSVDNDIKSVSEKIRRELDRVDILVHSAGAMSTGPVESASVEDFDVQYRINVRAPYLLTQTMLPMLKASHGQIVFINSSLWLRARGSLAQYAATKFALKAVADSLRDEVNADSIRVVSVFPGQTAGPLQEARYAARHAPYHPETLLQPADIATTVMSALALSRTAEITDISIRPFRKPLDRKD